MPAARTRSTVRQPTATVPGLVLGIDPGLQRTGYALVLPRAGPREPRLLEAGVIRLRSQRPLAERLAELEVGLQSIMRAFRPAALACEELYAHYRHPRTAILMGHARGVVLLQAARAGLEIIPLAATHVKKLLTGSGRATKRQVQLAVTATFNLPTVPEPDDVADALAIALSGVRYREAHTTAAADKRRRVVP
ncbi:MAG: crossover junction endodeoxyribonuclease RuvC [Planctomycetota bacterium]